MTPKQQEKSRMNEPGILPLEKQVWEIHLSQHEHWDAIENWKEQHIEEASPDEDTIQVQEYKKYIADYTKIMDTLLINI